MTGSEGWPPDWLAGVGWPQAYTRGQWRVLEFPPSSALAFSADGRWRAHLLPSRSFGWRLDVVQVDRPSPCRLDGVREVQVLVGWWPTWPGGLRRFRSALGRFNSDR